MMVPTVSAQEPQGNCNRKPLLPNMIQYSKSRCHQKTTLFENTSTKYIK